MQQFKNVDVVSFLEQVVNCRFADAILKTGIRDLNYPLVEWNMTEAECLAYCKERGFDWDGLYDIFSRLSCWCCPLQSLDELRKLRKYFPELWERLRYMDKNTWRKFSKIYSVEELEVRFAYEDELLENGLRLKVNLFLMH